MAASDYRARVEISDAAGHVLAEVGASCDRVPDGAIANLLKVGAVERKPITPTAPAPVFAPAASASAPVASVTAPEAANGHVQ